MTRVLLIEGDLDSAGLATPIATALGRHDVALLRLSVARRGAGLLDALLGDAERRRLERETLAFAPEVVLVSEPDLAQLLVSGRARARAPVVCLVPELAPRRAWTKNADRYLVVDDEAAVLLSDAGVDGARVQVIGPVAAAAYFEARASDRSALRLEFGIPDLPVALIDTRSIPPEALAGLLLQLALFERRMTTLFYAPDDGTARLLRAQTAGMSLSAKLFGANAEAARLWRTAELVLSRPQALGTHSALAVGCAFLAVEPANDFERAEIKALEERGIGTGVDRMVFLAGALEPWIRDGARRKAACQTAFAHGVSDGAKQVAEILSAIAAERESVLAETTAFATPEPVPNASSQATASPLEDLGATRDRDPFRSTAASSSSGAAAQLVVDLGKQAARLEREMDEARKAAERWEERSVNASARGDTAAASEAAREADRKRARMHTALEELSMLAEKRNRLAGSMAPSDDTINEMLEKLRRKAADQGKSVDDQLAAMKKKVETEKKRK